MPLPLTSFHDSTVPLKSVRILCAVTCYRGGSAHHARAYAVLGLPYDFAIDTWAAGCCLYEMYTGTVGLPRFSCLSSFSVNFLVTAYFLEQSQIRSNQLRACCPLQSLAPHKTAWRNRNTLLLRQHHVSMRFSYRLLDRSAHVSSLSI